MNHPETALVIGRDGLHGRIVDLGQSAQANDRQVLVQFDNGQRVLVPFKELILQDDGSYYVPIGPNDVEQQGTLADDETKGTTVLPVVEEKLHVDKRRVVTGGVRVKKVVHEHEEVVDEPLLSEEAHVERVPIYRVLDQAVSVRQEGDTMIIPIVEEILVVEKRLMLKEEIRITKQQKTTHKPQQVTLRTEEVIVEPIEPQA